MTLGRFGQFTLPRLFKFAPFWLLAVLLLGVAAANPVLAQFQFHWNTLTHFEAGVALAAFFLVVIVYFIGDHMAAPLAKTIAGDVAVARQLLDACTEKSDAHFQQEQERIKNEFETSKQTFNRNGGRAARDIEQVRGVQPTTISAKTSRLLQKNEQWWQRELAQLKQRHDETLVRLKEEDAAKSRQLAETNKTLVAQIESDHRAGWQKIGS